jgi:hypothetical protein
MNVFQLQYHKSSVLVTTLAGVPTIGALLMFIMLYHLPINTSFWLISMLITTFLLIMIFILRWVIKTQIFVPCAVSIEQEQMKLEITENNLFYNKRNFSAPWENILSIEEKFSIQHGNYSYAVIFTAPYFKANFSMKENYEDEAENFFKLLRYYQENKKISNIHQQKQITKDFHDRLASN